MAKPPGEDALAGILWMIVTGLLFAGVTAIVRAIGETLPAVEAAFLRYVFGLVLVLPALVRVFRSRPGLNSYMLYFGRSIVHGIAVILWFYAMARIPMTEVTAIGYTSPIFVTIGAALFLGERLNLARIAAVIAGFVGAMVIIRPGFQEIKFGQLAQVAAAPLFALSFIMTKKLTGREDASSIVAMLSLFVTIVLLPGALLNWVAPTSHQVVGLAVTAAIATAGHYTQTRAFKAAPLTLTQPIGFLQLVWASVIGVIAFDELPDPFVILGAAIIIGAITFVSHRETRGLRRQP